MTAGRWRPALANDLPALFAIAERVHPDFPEDFEIFEERLQLCPDGLWTLDSGEGPIGYLISHPWIARSAPPLGHRLGALPDHSDIWYVHDLALLSDARGTGAAKAIIERVASQAAQAGYPSLSLVAVNQSVPFWSRNGFSLEDVPELAKALASYGAAARFMVRPL